MRHYMNTRALIGVALLVSSFAASAALLEDQNKFVVVSGSNGCVMELQPERDMLDIAFETPDTIQLQSSYGFIGSGLNLSIDNSPDSHLRGNDTNSSRRVAVTLTPEQIAAIQDATYIKISSDTSIGSMYRRVRLRDFAKTYEQFKSCAAKS